MKVFLIRQIDPELSDKRKRGSDNAKWDKKIKDAKDIYLDSFEFLKPKPVKILSKQEEENEQKKRTHSRSLHRRI